MDEHFAVAYSEKAGIQMECYTDRSCVPFYSGNFTDGAVGKSLYQERWIKCGRTDDCYFSIHTIDGMISHMTVVWVERYDV